jgi:O-antigen/teichoic acid export membrane protein
MFRLEPFDNDGKFVPKTADARTAVRGAGVTIFSGGIGLGIQIVATVVLARLIAPAVFGSVAMVTTFSLLLVNFGLNGFTEAIIQREQLTDSLASNLFWIQASIGFTLSVSFALLGPVLARFYHDTVVSLAAVGISLTIFITSLSVIHLALLKRAMCFSSTSGNDVFSRAVSVAVSVLLALFGFGVWALIVGLIAQTVGQTVGAWWMCRWVPQPPRRVPGTAAMIRFALHVYGRFSVNYCVRNVDNLLVGWRFGALSLGFYKKAYDLFALSANQITAPLTNVAVSALSRLPPRSDLYHRYLTRSLALMAFLGMGLAGVLTLSGKDLISLLLGAKWAPAGEIFVLFGPGVGAMLIYYINGWIHLSSGRPDRWLRWGIIELVSTFLLFLAGLPWGAKGIAAAWTISFWILTIPALWYAGRPIGFGIAPIVSSTWRYVVASSLAGFSTAEVLRHAHIYKSGRASFDLMTSMICSSALFLAQYLVAVILLHWGLGPLREVITVIREVISRRAVLRPAALS